MSLKANTQRSERLEGGDIKQFHNVPITEEEAKQLLPFIEDSRTWDEIVDKLEKGASILLRTRAELALGQNGGYKLLGFHSSGDDVREVLSQIRKPESTEQKAANVFETIPEIVGVLQKAQDILAKELPKFKKNSWPINEDNVTQQINSEVILDENCFVRANVMPEYADKEFKQIGYKVVIALYNSWHNDPTIKKEIINIAKRNKIEYLFNIR